MKSFLSLGFSHVSLGLWHRAPSSWGAIIGSANAVVFDYLGGDTQSPPQRNGKRYRTGWPVGMASCVWPRQGESQPKHGLSHD